MQENICLMCNTKFYSYTERSNITSSDKCQRKFYNGDKERPFRTSTPIANIVNNVTENNSDSVSDFFYQTWKNGLQASNRGCDTETIKCCCCHGIQQPYCYSQIVYVNTVLWPPLYSVMNAQIPQLGYRADGTFGVLPTYWSYFVNY